MKTPETEATKDGRPSGLAVAPCSGPTVVEPKVIGPNTGDVQRIGDIAVRIRVAPGEGETIQYAALTGLGNLEWTLRYGDVQSVRYLAASVVDSYRALILATQARRNFVVRSLRKARDFQNSKDEPSP